MDAGGCVAEGVGFEPVATALLAGAKVNGPF
jgi:hypothetical protein